LIIPIVDPNSEILSELTDSFCPRFIVFNGLIFPIYTVAHFRSSANRLWIPRTIGTIPSNFISEQTHIKSIAVEIGSNFNTIEVDAFSRTDLEFLTFPI
jgi:hypothetical protein